jgi:hypothetical protein
MNQVLSSRPAPVYRDCLHFQKDPGVIESEYAGLTAMCSGFAPSEQVMGFVGCIIYIFPAGIRTPGEHDTSLGEVAKWQGTALQKLNTRVQFPPSPQLKRDVYQCNGFRLPSVNRRQQILAEVEL